MHAVSVWIAALIVANIASDLGTVRPWWPYLIGALESLLAQKDPALAVSLQQLLADAVPHPPGAADDDVLA